MTPDRSDAFLPKARAFVADFAAYRPRDTLLAAGLMLAGGLLEGVGLALLIPLAGLLVGSTGGRWHDAMDRVFATVGVEVPMARLALVLALFVALVALRAIVLTWRDRRIAALQLGYIEHLRVRLIRALAGARWQDIAGLRHARVTNALASDILRIAGATQMLVASAVAIVMLAAQWLLTLLIAPILALVAAVLILIVAIAALPMLSRATRVGEEVSWRHLKMMDTAGQLLGGLKLAMAQNMQAGFARDFEESARDLTARQLRFSNRQSVMRVVTASGTALAGAAVLLIGLWFAVPLANLLAAIVILSRMSGPATALQQNAPLLANALPAHAALTDLIADLSTAAPPAPAAPVDSGGDVTFDRVSYAHPGGAGLHSLDLTIGHGEFIGIAGASGAGKTTFVDLLAGLLSPDNGTIRVGGVALDSGNAHGFRDRIAYVAQDTYLLNDSIRRNVAWGRPDIDDAELWRALDAVGAGELVRGLDLGLETVIAERGARLSGGERQRIALARALVRRPDLLILDEATNAIDVFSERRILHQLKAMTPRPTIVIVAHRAESLALCDRIVTFDDGQLADAPVAGRPTASV